MEELNINQALINIASNPAFSVAATHIIINDLLLRLPNKNWEFIVSFEATILYFLISINKSINIHNNDGDIKALEEQIRNLLKKFENSLLEPSPQPNKPLTKEEILKYLDNINNSQNFFAASFLYAGDEAYPSQYPDLILNRYRLDESWFINNLKISFDELFKCMMYLIEKIPIPQDNIQNNVNILIFDLNNIPPNLMKPMDIFIKYFATDLGNTKTFSLKNILQFQTKPIIRLDDTHLLLPPPIILMQAVCESPLYWMIADKEYANIAWKHRGEITVDMVYKWISFVFGPKNVFKNILIKKGNQDITDIDVLAVFQNKAIIFQIKSKKATLETKLGNQEQFIQDFEKSIQSAYNQAILSIQSIKNNDCDFILDGNKIDIPDVINDFYIFCVTTEQFKTLNIRLQKTLKIDISFVSTPVIAISTFDLEILALYLHDPYDFLYYLHRRKILKEKIFLSEEINILVAFLKHGLRDRPADKIYFSNDFLDILNDHFRPWPTKELIESSYQWKQKDKERIISSIKTWNYPNTNDLISFIYENYNKLSIASLEKLIHIQREHILNLLNSSVNLLDILSKLNRKIGRNEKCPCLSGKKYKHCCGK